MRGMAAVFTRVVMMLFCLSVLLHGQATTSQQQAPASASGSQQPSTLDDELSAGDEDNPNPVRQLVKWNHFEGKYLSVKVGGGFLYEYDAYAQDRDSKEQFSLFATPKLRDTRVWVNGALKFIKRPTTYTAAVMYDANTGHLLVRQTGLMIAFPELSGYIFVGRSKEGISLSKIMVGYAGWTMERAAINDATIPILADGIKWLGYAPEKHLLWNLGVFGDALSEGQSFSTYRRQAVGRIAWLPMENEEDVLHIGVAVRYGKPKNDSIQFRSRPESWPAPYFIDTGKIPSTSTTITQFETYYRPGSLLLGTEYFLVHVNSPETGNPFFNGGELAMTWLPTGEIRAYNTRGGFFEQVSPKRTVFNGGPGAWELVGRFSYANLNSGPVRGGIFWRFTPMVNWYMSDNVRLEFSYGYGSLDRFNLVGKTQFFQTRVQLQF
jgi:phosphate-selective porin OprO and OprP